MAKDESQNLTEQIAHIGKLVQTLSMASLRSDDGSGNDNATTIVGRVEDQLKTLSHSFGLSPSDDNTVDALLQFIIRYVHSTADYLNAFSVLAEQSNIDDYTHAFLQTAAKYFFESHPITDSTKGVEALLCKAYLCHRTLEELNDRILAERQWPLAPCDTAHANLITHTIIGDERANLLDQTVLINLELTTAKQTQIQQSLFKQASIKEQSQTLREQGWSTTLEQWPFLGEDMTAALLG